MRTRKPLRVVAPEDSSSASPKVRSPAYPSISLRDAVERGRKIYEQSGKAGSLRDAALKHMGYSGPTGASLPALSSLKKFGLFEDRNGRLVPTPRGLDIFVRQESDPRRQQALRDAAVEPAIYSKLLERCGPDGKLPSPLDLRTDLELDMGFTAKAIPGLIADFKETLIYAGMLQGDTIVLSQDAPEDEVEEEAPVRKNVRGSDLPATGGPAVSSNRVTGSTVPLDARTITLSTLLPGGSRVAVLQVDAAGLTEDDFDYLADWLKFQGKAFGRQVARGKTPEILKEEPQDEDE